MRVYIAINFEDNIKEYFHNITSNIKEYCVEGNFTRKNNFHMTIRFIGEVPESEVFKIKDVIDKAVLDIPTFELCVNNLGVFRRKKTNILWMGIEENEVLSTLHKELSKVLNEYKIPFYDKMFMPHITLGRRVSFKNDSEDLNTLINFEKISFPVNSLSLMASIEENGKLNGVPLHEVIFK